MRSAVFSGVVCALCLSSVQGVTVPAGFVTFEVAPSGDWQEILDIAFAPDGRIFVAEKRGMVWIVRDGVKQADPFLDLRTEVLSNGDRGLLSLALDPNFSSAPHVYLFYTVDPNGDGNDDDLETFSRLTRYSTSVSNPDTAIPSTRHILIGHSWSDGIPAVYNTHSTGTLRFGTDGTLLVSHGDGAHADTPDAGGRDPGGFGPGKFSSAEDIGAFRSQWLGSLAGKILRIDPATGEGISSNPFFDGDPLSNVSRVFAYGLRNPFRYTIRPGTGSSNPSDAMPGTLYVGDVGWTTWEEVSVVHGGENLGWPCREGFAVTAQYPSQTPAHSGCGTLGTPGNPRLPTNPLIDWHHTNASLSHPPPLVGKCTAGVTFYTGNTYPSQYQGALFFADYGAGWIRAARVTPSNTLIDILDFATGAAGVVDLETDPASGDLLYVSIVDNEIRRIRFDPTNLPPSAQASGSPTSGSAPLAVQFSSAGSSDPNGDALAYLWDFGDGSSSTGPAPLHTYTIGGVHTAILTVDDGRGGQGSAEVQVDVIGGVPGNQVPSVTIASPTEAALYLPGARLDLDGNASDDDPPQSLDFRWEIILHHNTHIHPGWLFLEGRQASFFPEDHDDGTGVFFEVVLRATDPDGATGSSRVYVYPPREPIIIDNGMPGTKPTGTWGSSGSDGFYGTSSLFSRTLGGTYDYSFATRTPGLHRVYGWWTYSSTRVTAVPHEITRVGGVSTVSVNQRDPETAGLWNSLGVFDLGATSRVRIVSTSTSLTTCADAVAIIPSKADRTIIDNVDSRTSRVGSWTTSTGSGAYGTNSVYSKVLGDSFTWNPVPTAPGVHEVHAWWTQIASRTTAAPYTVSYESGSQIVKVNQRTNGGQWNLLGTYRFDRTAQVVVNAVGGTATTAADAVELVFLPLDRIIDDGEQGTSSTGTWSVSTTAGAYGPRSVFVNQSGPTYTWEIPVRVPGSYELLAWWTASVNRTTAAPYDVTHALGTTTVLRSQKENGWRWNSLGTYTFGAKAVVRLRANANGVSFSADAVRLRRASSA